MRNVIHRGYFAAYNIQNKLLIPVVLIKNMLCYFYAHSHIVFIDLLMNVLKCDNKIPVRILYVPHNIDDMI